MSTGYDSGARAQRPVAIWLAAMGIVVLLVVGLFRLSGHRVSPAPREGLALIAAGVPAEAQVLGLADMRGTIDAATAIDTFEKLIVESPELSARFEALQKSLGVSLKSVASWALPAGWFAVLPADGEKSLIPADPQHRKPPVFIAALLLKDDETARRDIATILRNANGAEVPTRQQDGITFWGRPVPGGDMEAVCAIYEHCLYVSNSREAVVRAARAQEARAPSLIEQPQFAEALTRVPSHNGLLMFCAVHDLVAPLGKWPTLKDYIDEQTLKGLGAVEYVVQGRPLDGDAAVFCKVDATSDSPFIKALLTRPSTSPTLAAWFPKRWGSYAAFDANYCGNVVYQLLMLFPKLRSQLAASTGMMALTLGFNPITEFQSASTGELAYSSDQEGVFQRFLSQASGQSRAMGQFTACESNLRNIGTAAEMYAIDHNGQYPEHLSDLTPKYLRAIPTCPAAGSDTYSATWTAQTQPPGFQVACGGAHHVEIGQAENLPAYSSAKGLTANNPRFPAQPQQNFLVAVAIKDASALTRFIEELEKKSRLTSAVVRTQDGNDIHAYSGMPLRWTLVTKPQTVFLLGVGPEADSQIDEAIASNKKPDDSVGSVTALRSLTDGAKDRLVVEGYMDLTPMAEAGLQYLNDHAAEWEIPPSLVKALSVRLKAREPLVTCNAISVETDGVKVEYAGFNVVTITAAGAIGAAILVPNFIRARAQGQCTACKSNLRNIGTACEMYSTDNAGRYPTSLSQLAPNYLKTIPTCPSAGADTYSATFQSRQQPDFYSVECHGLNHAGVGDGENYPRYTSTQGLMER